MPVPYAPPVTLADEERSQLEALTRAHSTPQALAFRCRLILRLAAPDIARMGSPGFRIRHGQCGHGVFPGNHWCRLYS